MSTVSVGFLGCAQWAHANAFANALEELADISVIGVADQNHERGHEFAQQHDYPFRASEALLADADGVIVCAPNADHVRAIQEAADAGVDILCDKPFTTSLEEAIESVQYCKEANVILGLAMQLRFSPPACEAKRVVEQGDIGSLLAISGKNRAQFPNGWFLDPKRSGGGAIIDHSVHLVDLIHWMTNKRVAEVYAEANSRRNMEVENINILSMILEDGTNFLLDGSWCIPEKWDHWGDVTLELIGERGILSVDCFGQTFKQTVDAGVNSGIEQVHWGTDPKREMLADFADAIRKNQLPEATGPEGVEVMTVVDAAYRSMKKHEPVTVEYS